MNEDLRTNFKITEEIGPPVVYCPYAPLRGNHYNYNEANYLLSGIGIIFGNSPMTEKSKIRLLSLVALTVSDMTVQNSETRLSFPQYINPIYFEYSYDQRGHMIIYRGTFHFSKIRNYSKELRLEAKRRVSSIKEKTKKDHLNELFDYVLREVKSKLKIQNGLHVDFSASEEKVLYNNDREF